MTEAVAVPVGFDYSMAVLHLSQRMSYEQMATICGYQSRSSIFRVATEQRVPSHPQGEAIWALYMEVFGVKPPMRLEQSNGMSISVPVREHRGRKPRV